MAAAMAVMEMEEVLEARMVSGLQISSSSLKMLFLMSRTSMAASTTRSQSLASASSRVKEMRLRTAFFSSSVILPLATFFSMFLVTTPSPRLLNSSAMSRTMTVLPASAKTWAMPMPMVPAPRTMILLIAIVVFLLRFDDI